MHDILLQLPMAIKVPILIAIIGAVYFSIARSAENDPNEREEPSDKKNGTPVIDEHEEIFFDPK